MKPKFNIGDKVYYVYTTLKGEVEISSMVIKSIREFEGKFLYSDFEYHRLDFVEDICSYTKQGACELMIENILNKFGDEYKNEIKN